MVERRKEKRKKEINRVSIEYLTEEPIEKIKKKSYALVENMSLSGLKILSDTFFPIGKAIKVELSLDKHSKPIYMIGKVKWIRNIDGEIQEMGLEIVDTFKESVQAVIKHLYGKEN